MTRDPLAVLARLRGAEVMAARRRLAGDAAARDAAGAGAVAAALALAEEGRRGGAEHAAWLPRGLALRDAAAAGAAGAEARRAESATLLAAARAAERVVEELAAIRAAEARRAALRGEQRVLDEAGGRRPG